MKDGAPLPLYGFVEGDSLGVLVLADGRQSVDVLARQLMQAAAPRVAPFWPAYVRCEGRLLDGRDSLLQCGVQALVRIDVARTRGDHGL